MSSLDEFRHANLVWTKNRIEGMVRGIDVVYDPYTGEKQGIDSDGYLGIKMAAYDTGNPEGILDCVQLEEAVRNIKDLPAKAAVTLRMYGWDEADIGSVLRDRKHRTGSQLVDTGIYEAYKYEKDRANASRTRTQPHRRR